MKNIIKDKNLRFLKKKNTRYKKKISIQNCSSQEDIKISFRGKSIA